jgi:hypothetical protein
MRHSHDLNGYSLKISAQPGCGRRAIPELGDDLIPSRKDLTNIDRVVSFCNIEGKFFFLYLL